MKYVLYLVLVILIILLLLLSFLFKTKNNFSNNENKSLILNTSSYGFYAMLLATVSNYYNFEKEQKNFKIVLDNWIYKYKYGWIDYFEPVDIKLNEDNNYKESVWNEVKNIKIKDIINTIPKIYKYNLEVTEYINNIKKELNIINIDYDAIYVRRGDKISENELVNDLEYIKALINKKPNVSNVFVQTDDYSVYLNTKEYIKNNNYNIKLFTICKENMKGAITDNNYKNQMLNKIDNDLKSKFQNIKPISEMSPEEKKEHMLELLTGVDILLNSNLCVVDYNTNVGRFVKYSHKNPPNVIDVNNQDHDINYEKIINCFETNLY
jgi:hypothetical protein